MKRTLFERIAALALALLLALPVFALRAEAANPANPIKKVGLKYGSSGVNAANLLNHTGAGYSLGYYDSARTFIRLLDTDERALTVTRDLTYNRASGTYSAGTESATIGGYHLQSAALSGAAEAVSEAERIRALGRTAAPAYINGKYYVRTGHYATAAAAAAAKDSTESAVGLSLTAVGGDGGVLRVTVTDSNAILFYFKAACGLGIAPRKDGDAACQTWFGGYRYYGGFEYVVNSSSLINVINVVDLVSYVKGVIPYEISASWPVEAQKAQALCAKCYAATASKHSSSGFDVCSTACCQVYRGNGATTALSDSAVEAIADKNMTYEGSAIIAYYSSSDGGATEDSENIWTNALGYLRGKKDIYEDASMIPGYRYTNTVTAAEVASILRSKGYAVASVSDMYVSKYTALGNVYTLTVVDGEGKKYDFSKATARTILGTSYVKSQRFTVTGGSGAATGRVSVNAGEGYLPLPATDVFVLGGKSGPVKVAGGPGLRVITGSGVVTLGSGAPTSTGSSAGIYTITGTGSGHNVGMSQWGLYCMAKQGMTYEDMLKFYYTGVEITDIAS